MQVKIRVIGNVWGALGLFWPNGKEAWIDEKQAELGVQSGTMEIIERPEQISVPAHKKKMNVR